MSVEPEGENLNHICCCCAWVAWQKNFFFCPHRMRDIRTSKPCLKCIGLLEISQCPLAFSRQIQHYMLSGFVTIRLIVHTWSCFTAGSFFCQQQCEIYKHAQNVPADTVQILSHWLQMIKNNINKNLLRMELMFFCHQLMSHFFFCLWNLAWITKLQRQQHCFILFQNKNTNYSL